MASQVHRHVLLCTDRHGSNSLYVYTITSREPQDHQGTAKTEWTIGLVPVEGIAPGEAYEATLAEVDEATARLVSVTNGLPPQYRGRGITPALLPKLAKHLGRRIVWSPSDASIMSTAAAKRLTQIWRCLVERGQAGETAGPNSFETTDTASVARSTASTEASVSRPVPTTEAEFLQLMEDVDAAARAQGIPIAGREMFGMAEVSRILAAEQWPHLAKGEPLEGSFEGLDLTIRISRWFDNRYGKSAQIDLRPGRMAVLMRGDSWRFHFPLLFGRHEMIISRTEPSDDVPPGPDVGPPPRYNILDAIVGLPDGLRASLTDDELAYLWDAFHVGLPSYLLMRSIRSASFVREALVDHDTCVHNLVGERAHPGAARWAALQATEKMCKSVLATLGERVPRTHDLTALATRLYDLGLEALDSNHIAAVQCDASVRYGEIHVTLPEAVAAHHAALAMSRQLALAVRSVIPESEVSRTGI